MLKEEIILGEANPAAYYLGEGVSNALVACLKKEKDGIGFYAICEITGTGGRKFVDEWRIYKGDKVVAWANQRRSYPGGPISFNKSELWNHYREFLGMEPWK